MKYIHLILILALALTSAAFAADPVSEFTRAEENVDGMTKHFKESLFRKTEKGLFSVELLIGGKKLLPGENKIDIVIHDSKDTDVEDADVIFGIRPAAQGVITEERAEGIGDGLYRIKSIRSDDPRNSEMVVKIRKGKMEDTAVFDISDMTD